MKPFLRGLAIVTAGLVSGLAAAHTRTPAPAAPAPDTEAGAVAEEVAGPTRVVSGVPAGFARTRVGAVAAASAFVRTGAAVMGMSDAQVGAAVAQMAASGSAAAQEADLLGGLRRLRGILDGADASYRQAVLAVRVDAYTEQRARVSVWHVGVLAAGEHIPPQAGWATSTFELIWERGDWKVWSETVTPGPAPIPDDSAPPAAVDDYRERLAGFADPAAA